MIKFKSLLTAQTTILVMMSIFLIGPKTWAATYYVDATNGNNNNHGLSSSMAWRTISEVNSSSFQPGDQILLKRGGVWREQLNFPSSGSPGNPITIGAYGSGARPVINGANIFSNWTSESVGGFTAYYAASSMSTNQVFENGNRLTKVNAKYELTPGTWWWDSSIKRIYMRTTGDNHPGTYTIEISRRDFGIWIKDESYITVENLELENSNDKGLDILAYGENINDIRIQNIVSSHNYHMGLRSTGFNGRRINNVIVENSVFKYNGADGISITANSDNFTIRKNTVHNNCILETPGDAELDWTGGIRAIGSSVENVIFEENEVHSNGKLNGKPAVGPARRGYGIWFDTVGPGGIMRRNNLHDNKEAGIRVEVTSDAKVYYNISYKNSMGVAVARKVHRNKIYNNVAYDNYICGIRVQGSTPAKPNNVTNNIVKNNIVTGNTIELDVRFGGENDGTAGYGNVYENNCFGLESQKFIMWANMSYIDTYDVWESAYGGNTHSIESEPHFTNAAGSDFSLQSSSPAIDAGVDVGLTHDFHNTAISPFKPVDIGAIEYHGTPADPVPPPSDLRIISVDVDSE